MPGVNVNALLVSSELTAVPEVPFVKHKRLVIDDVLLLTTTTIDEPEPVIPCGPVSPGSPCGPVAPTSPLSPFTP